MISIESDSALDPNLKISARFLPHSHLPFATRGESGYRGERGERREESREELKEERDQRERRKEEMGGADIERSERDAREETLPQPTQEYLAHTKQQPPLGPYSTPTRVALWWSWGVLEGASMRLCARQVCTGVPR